MLGKTLSTVATTLICLLIAQVSNSTFIPDKDIKNKYQVFSERDANMTQQEFNQAIEKAERFYSPIIQSHGGKLVINRKWTDDTLNASAQQMFGTWTVNMYGGLARHPEMTLDGFAMVLCHEIGHHLAGFSFKKMPIFFGGTWAANEGQSDYFAAHSCSRELWKDEVAKNAEFRKTVKPIVQENCDMTWTSVEEQNLCYRINAGGESLARVLSALKEDPVAPTYETPDSNKVSATDHNHPAAQCRLDTTFSASLCPETFNPDFIPGKQLSDQFGAEAEKEASRFSCTEYGNFNEGLRPRCWYKPGI